MSRLLPVAMLVLFVWLAPSTQARELYHEQAGYYLDLPAGWEVINVADDGGSVFVSPDGSAMMQIEAHAGDRYDSATAMYDRITENLGASGDFTEFVYNDFGAGLADIEFAVSGEPVRGYAVLLDGTEADFAALAFAAEDSWGAMHDMLVSVLDSFAPRLGDLRFPGPVSQFFQPLDAESDHLQELDFKGAKLYLPARPQDEDANQVLIDREARVLNTYQPGTETGTEAWRRYYRMIYRDTALRLMPLVPHIRGRLRREEIRDEQVPAELLSWLQGFEYARRGGISDFDSALTCLTGESGDCDSLAMIYIILLQELGYDAILMVSPVHAHAMAAVDVEGQGARFTFEGTAYLVAELTDDVSIGLIDQRMSDPADWFGVEFTSFRP